MQVDSPSKVDRIYEIFEKKILSGVWSIGECLPTEMELAEQLDCGRNTISKAITRLVHEGFVDRRKRAGTKVIRNTSRRAGAGIELDAFAFIYPSEQHDSIWRTLRGFQDAAKKSGRRVVMLSSGGDYQREIELVGRLTEFDVKGAVVFPLLSTPAEVAHFSHLIVSSNSPVVLTEIRLPSLAIPTVLADTFHASYSMTKHLISRGAKRVGFLANYAHISAVRDEYRGYRWALEEASLEVPENGVLQDPGMNPDFENPLGESTRLGRKYLDASDKVDAVVCANDFLAAGCIIAAKERNLSVPKDLLVASCDDYSIDPINGVNLTSYKIPHHEIGRKTFEMLDSLINDGAVAENEILVRGELKLGTSS